MTQPGPTCKPPERGIRTDAWAHATWGGGQLLAFSGLDGPTDFYHGLTLRTVAGASALEVKLPGEARLDFDPQPPRHCRLGSDFLLLETARGSVRGALLDARHLLIEGPCAVRFPDAQVRRLRVRAAGDRTLVGSCYGFDSTLIDANLDAALAARRAWVESCPLLADAGPLRRAALVKACAQLKGMVYSPEGQFRRRFSTPDRWPHRNVWLWDSAFHAVGYRHLDPGLAREILEAVLDGQAEDGMVPLQSEPAARRCDHTQPPTLSMAAALVLETEDSPAWLHRLYPHLADCVRWDLEHRDSDGGGLAEWAIEVQENCRSGESGMDNSPRFDLATQLDAVDFNSLLANECEHLAAFAERLGRAAEADAWRKEHGRLCRLIEERLWSDRHGFYVDYDVDRGQPSEVLASSGFLPLLCGAASPERAEALRRALHDAALFAAPVLVPSIAVGDTEHYAKDMWRGPVWVNLNWMIARGFQRYGMRAEAELILKGTVAEIERWYGEYGTFFEFFDDRREVAPPTLMRKGGCAPDESPYHQVFFDYGWTAALYLDICCSGC